MPETELPGSRRGKCPGGSVPSLRMERSAAGQRQAISDDSVSADEEGLASDGIEMTVPL
jgi:hypothetical protein